LDTLTSLGGRAGQLQWFLHNNALLALYAKDGGSELYRIDPWSRETRDLTKGRFGAVTGFDLARAGDRLAFCGGSGKNATLWVSNPDLETPVAIAGDQAFAGSPRWDPAGEKLAWLAANPADSGSGETPGGELRVFVFKTKTLINATSHSRVRSFAWSADGKRVFYSAGVNLADVNAFRVDSMTLAKVTPNSQEPRSEERPAPKLLGDRDGILFEAAAPGGRKLMWMDLKTLEEQVVADSAGYNSLK
jgi:hypothetical protein